MESFDDCTVWGCDAETAGKIKGFNTEGTEVTAWRSRNQSELQRLKPLPKGLVTTGLKPGPPKKKRSYARCDEFEE